MSIGKHRSGGPAWAAAGRRTRPASRAQSSDERRITITSRAAPRAAHGIPDAERRIGVTGPASAPSAPSAVSWLRDDPPSFSYRLPRKAAGNKALHGEAGPPTIFSTSTTLDRHSQALLA